MSVRFCPPDDHLLLVLVVVAEDVGAREVLLRTDEVDLALDEPEGAQLLRRALGVALVGGRDLGVVVAHPLAEGGVAQELDGDRMLELRACGSSPRTARAAGSACPSRPTVVAPCVAAPADGASSTERGRGEHEGHDLSAVAGASSPATCSEGRRPVGRFRRRVEATLGPCRPVPPSASDRWTPPTRSARRSSGGSTATSGVSRSSATTSSSTRRTSPGWPRSRPTGRSIAAELDEILQYHDDLPNFQDISTDQYSITDDDRWKTFFLYGYGFKAGTNVDAVPRHRARSCESIPGMKTAMFSILAPHKHIPAHGGPYKGVLRYHLALKVPGPAGRAGSGSATRCATWARGQEPRVRRRLRARGLERLRRRARGAVRRLRAPAAGPASWLNARDDQGDRDLTVRPRRQGPPQRLGEALRASPRPDAPARAYASVCSPRRSRCAAKSAGSSNIQSWSIGP